ncbi:AsmA-like C-terminal region-containing protein [Pontiellaceae bacterium B12219]|nr:AsmA-like C-terminal region-containing protein [Pontiellaceae bacterium B12219]
MSRIVFNVIRFSVRLLSLLAVLLICGFVFLRLYGVPGPVLKELVKRANAAGIPVDVESVILTLRGWKASDVAYYSKNPDDLHPVFQAREVLFVRKVDIDDPASKQWRLEIDASDIQLSPSVNWGVSLPENSKSRRVDRISLTLGFQPDRVEFIDGEMTWLGLDFKVGGVLLKDQSPDRRMAADQEPAQKTVLPVYISSAQFRALENRLLQVKMDGAAEVDLQFMIDAGNFAASSIDFSVHADRTTVRGVEFDALALKGCYTYPELRLDKVRVSRNSQSLEMNGGYDLKTKLAQLDLNNTITSRQLLLLAPQSVMDLLVKAQLQFDELPQFSLRFGPALLEDLPDAISGTFSIRDLTYCELLIESVRGNVDRTDGLLDLTGLHANVHGQEERADEVGSAMHGGEVRGRVFWDANRETFGVEADATGDPNLLLKPLAFVPVATNAIGRFKFPEDPPKINLKLGANYRDWSTFYINIHGMGNQVRLHEGLMSSLNTSGYYSNGVLRLEPIAAMSGVDFMKGTASINFFDSTATFDAFGTLSPALLEDAVFPGFHLFGNKVRTFGNTQFKARGVLDWKTMLATDFSAKVETDRLEIPIAALDGFSGTVKGAGPLISISDAEFTLYGGQGSGDFSIELDPASKGMPYTLKTDLSGVDFKQCLEYMKLPCREHTKGKVSAQAAIQADMRENFYETATGAGRVSIVDGELADIPLFSSLSHLMRKVLPGFKTFSITRLNMNFKLDGGVLSTENASFEGDIFNAKASGTFDQKTGCNAQVQLQILSDKGLTRVIRMLTNPFFKLFELRLTGPLSDPTWRLDKFSGGKSSEIPAE